MSHMSHEEMDSILGVPDVLPVVDDEISFDLGETLDREFEERQFNTPAVGQRFNVLRPPQRPAYEPPPPRVPSPQAGPMREVARVGRFAVLTEQEPPPNVRSHTDQAIQELSERQPEAFNPGVRGIAARDRQMAATLNAERQARREAMHETLPTSYDRLLADDPYEDDLE